MTVTGEIDLMLLRQIPWRAFDILGVSPLFGCIVVHPVQIELPFLAQRSIHLQALELFDLFPDWTMVWWRFTLLWRFEQLFELFDAMIMIE
jgi:hypothetical protein